MYAYSECYAGMTPGKRKFRTDKACVGSCNNPVK